MVFHRWQVLLSLKERDEKSMIHAMNINKNQTICGMLTSDAQA